MSQRTSGYERKANDLYETPEWVTAALIDHLPDLWEAWEPACGSGKILAVLNSRGIAANGGDITGGYDFLAAKRVDSDAIITNPPFHLATEFIEHALRLTNPFGRVAMLLRTDFDHAKTRRHLFADHPAFAKKLVLTKRIVWFERPRAAPSFNHAWFIWDWRHKGPPTIAYH